MSCNAWSLYVCACVSKRETLGDFLCLSSGIQRICKVGQVSSGEDQEIKVILDMNLIREKVKASSFDYKDCMRLVESIVGILCRIQDKMAQQECTRVFLNRGCGNKAARGEKVSCISSSSRRSLETTHAKWSEVLGKLQAAKEKRECTQAFCSSLEFCLERIHAIQNDTANKKLRNIAPVINGHNGIEYLHNIFYKKLDNKQITTDGTRDWIASSVGIALADQLVLIDDLRAGLAPAYHTVLRVGVVNLISPSSTSQSLPETMLLNKDRIQGKFRRLFGMHVSCATVLVTAEQIVRYQWRLPNAGQVMQSLSAEAACLLEQQMMPDHGSSSSNESLKLLQMLREHCDESLFGCAEALVKTNLREDNAVYLLLVSGCKMYFIAFC